MIYGAKVQNKTLKAAASDRIDTSPRVQKSTQLSAKVSGSTMPGRITGGENKVNHNPVATKNSMGHLSGKPRGSMEGLVKNSSTMIQMNGTGYLNPRFQKARYSQSQKFQGIDTNKHFTNIKKSGKIDKHSSIAAMNSSAYKMNSKLQVQKIFS